MVPESRATAGQAGIAHQGCIQRMNHAMYGTDVGSYRKQEEVKSAHAEWTDKNRELTEVEHAMLSDVQF